MKILAIDDSNSARYVMIKLLRDLGYQEITAVESAEDGLQKCRTNKFDVILLDWHLGGMSGLEFLKRIRADPALKKIAVIMVTTVNERSQVMQALKVGIQGYFFKPVTKEMMEAKLRELEARILAASESSSDPPAG
jgi:two-component system, chemotaxis family, chemotaxis protein CheY